MNAVTMLKDEHKVVRDLLEQIDRTTERGVQTRERLLARLKDALTAHEVIEEEIFYPALRQHPRAVDMVLEAYEEHNVVDTIMSELEGVPFDDETWKAKFTVMKENIEHHVGEEEGELFPKARQVFSAEELVELGRAMADREAEWTAEVAAAPGSKAPAMSGAMAGDGTKRA